MTNIDFKTLTILAFMSFQGNFSASENPNTLHHMKGFQENKGQITDQNQKARPDVLFSGNDGQMVYHMRTTGMSYQLNKAMSRNGENLKNNESKPIIKAGDKMSAMDVTYNIYRLDVNWLNASFTTIEKGSKQNAFDNFYTEAAPSGIMEVCSYDDITYKNIYPGIDLKWFQKEGHLKYDFILSPGADYHRIQLSYQGAQKLSINTNGELIIKTPFGDLKEQAPLVYQNGKSLPAKWRIQNNVVSFQIEGVDDSKALVIDPLVRSWGTYYGGSGYDWVGTTYTDANGNLYVAGGSSSGNLQSIATIGAFQTTYAGGATYGDAYLVKFNAAGQRQWGTYFGGSGTDFAYCCLVDGAGDVYIAGGTTSTNSAVMTTSGCQQNLYSSGTNTTGDAYVAKFNNSGARLWSTYYGENNCASGITCDAQNNVYVTGWTGAITGSNVNVVASVGAHQTSYGGGALDGFLVKLNSNGLRQWGTYFGGSGDEQSYNCISDAAGNVYIGGVTSSSSAIASVGAFQTNYGGSNGGFNFGVGDAYIAKFNTNGIRQWGTYYGGSGDECIYYCAMDATGNVYFSGSTTSSTGNAIATAGGHQSTYGGGADDAMLVKFDATGQRLWGTYYGGAGLEEWCCCFVEKGNGNVYLSGISSSGGTNIATPCAYQNNIGGSKDAFLAKFNLQGSRLWGTYYGSTGIEDWSALTVDALGAVYLAGETTSQNAAVMSSSGAHQTTYGGGSYDAFVAKFDGCITVTPSGSLQACRGQNAYLSLPQSCNIKWYSDSLATNFLYQGATFTTNPLNNDTIFWARDASCGGTSFSGKVKITTVTSPTINITTASTLVCYGDSYTLTASGANTYTWASVTSTNQSVVITATNSITHGVDGSLSNGCKASKTIYIQVNQCTGLRNQELNNAKAIMVYPNPNNGYFTLSSTLSTRVILINQLGELMQTFDLSEGNQFQEQVKQLPAGLYFIHSNNANGNYSQKMIVID